MIPSKGWPSVYQNTAVRIINESNIVYAIDPIMVSLIVFITTSKIAGGPVTTTESTFPSSSRFSRGGVYGATIVLRSTQESELASCESLVKELIAKL